MTPPEPDQPGEHTFRLTSDDGSRLRIDDTVVIDHDGLHAAEAKEGVVTPTAGTHPLRIDYVDATFDQVLQLAWRPPGASEFTVVPTAVLSTDAGVVRVTAPGNKERTGGVDTPGDGLPLAGVNPDYTLTDLRPPGFKPQVTAMDWTADGRMLIATWGGEQTADQGAIYRLDGVTGATDPSRVTYTKIAEGLREPMGLAVVDGLVYVSQKHELTEMRDTDGDDLLDARRTVATWPYGGNFHEFAFGLLYRDGKFHLNLSVAIDYGGATTTPQPATDRGTSITVDRATGTVDYVAGGLRTPHGIGWGPGGEVLVTDNQGGWLPASTLVAIEPGQFHQHYTTPPGRFDDRPVTAPVLWLPQNEIGNSPSTPVTVPSGPTPGSC